jgi:hypothetical protein
MVVRPAKAGAFSGNRPAKANARSLVAWMAGRRETDRQGHRKDGRESPGRSASERTGGPENERPGRPEPITVGAKAASSVVGWLTRCTTPAVWYRQHGDKDAQSNWRSPPPSVVKVAEQDRPYNRRPGKAAEEERVAEGSVRAMKRSNDRRAKGPCCLCFLREQGKQG